MEASVVTMPAVESKHAKVDLKNNNAESRMNTSSKNNAITLDHGRLANEFDGKPISSNQNSQEVQNSQSTVEESNATTASTPPTSDDFSSQSQESQLSQLSAIAAAQEPVNLNGLDPAPCTTAPSAGQKRTASGMIKPHVAKSPTTSPKVGSNGGHTRGVSNNSSTSTSSSRIAERSAELRARLSYAMVKVNNGWQSLPIDEVESRVSQAVSPTSSTSTLQGRRNRITSPRTAIASVQTESSSPRPFSSSAPVLGASNTLASLTTDQPSRTYESFWREHSVNANPTYRPSAFQPHPSLAPPVDIVSTSSSPSRNALHHPRRSNPSGTSRPPVVPIKTLSDLSQSSITSPQTPTRDPAIDSMLRTPSQKSAQEQDAIESLLFMSSPGNSTTLMHNFPPPHQPPSNQQSPLRSEFTATGTKFSSSQPQSQSHRHSNSNNTNRDDIPNMNRTRRVGFRTEEDDESSEGGYSVSRVPSDDRTRMGMGRSRMRGDEVDRMLDAMEDESSDEDDIDLVTTPRRRVVGGVGVGR